MSLHRLCEATITVKSTGFVYSVEVDSTDAETDNQEVSYVTV
jgi:hypothetical protein